MEKQVLLIQSNSMKSNKKDGRDENTLLRASEINRKYLKLKNNKTTTLYTNNDDDYENETVLKPFKAFVKDIRNADNLYDKGIITENELKQVCFVTPETFNKFSKDANQEIVRVVIDRAKVFDKMLIGTDPELLIMENGNVIKADCIPGFSRHTKFGSDGAMAELRPDPSYTPEGLVENIRKLLIDNEMTQHIKKYNWVSACYFENNQRDFPVGTHLHFDNPKEIKKLDNATRKRLFAVTNKILDELLTIPMIRIDGRLGHNRRARCKMSQAMGYGNQYGTGYGFFGEWRVCEGRLEHRSLSGLTISNPNICKDVFGVGKAIVEAIYKEVINKDLDSKFILPDKYTKTGIYEKTFKDWGKIPLTDFFNCTNSSEFMRITMDNSSRVDIGVGYIKKWLNKLRKLSTYGKYENYIESLGELLCSDSKILNKLNRNIKQNWGV